MSHNPPVFSLAQIKLQLQSQWVGDPHTESWNGATVEYGLPSVSPNLSEDESAGFQAMTSKQQTFVRNAFELWDDLIAINLNEKTVNPESAQITFAFSTSTEDDSTYTSTYLTELPPGGSTFERQTEAARIWFSQSSPTWDENQSLNLRLGGRGLENMLHEIGHALGLSHPGSYNDGDADPDDYHPDAEYTQDTQQWTVMSYFNAGDDGTAIDRTGSTGEYTSISTPLLHDIAAIQAKYGADGNTRTGNDVYGYGHDLNNSGQYRTAYDFRPGFNHNPVVAIWDAGGIDTLDVSGFAENQKIDLHAGAFSSVGALSLNVAIAFNVTIENAVGGSGRDTITGNSVGNYLQGRGGSDTIYGEAGNDTLFGEAGDDVLFGGADRDHLDGGTDSDYASYIGSAAGIEVDLLSPGFNSGEAIGDTYLSIENLQGSQFDDFLWANDSDNDISGLHGADLIYGRGGLDVLFGDEDNDTLNGGGAGDVLIGGTGSDTASYSISGVGLLVDLVHPGSNTGEAIGDTYNSIENLLGSSFDDTLRGNAAANWLRGGGGNDTLVGGLGADLLEGGTGNDTYFVDSDFDQVRDFTGRGYDRVFTSATFRLHQTLAEVEELRTTSSAGTTAINLSGSDSANLLVGNAGVNTLEGRGGNDVLIGGVGADVLNGGDNFDTASYASALGGVLVVLDTPSYNTGDAAGDSYIGIENLTGSAFNDFLYGGDFTNVLSGGAGDDGLVGQDSGDTLDGGPGSDTAYYDASPVGLRADLLTPATNTHHAVGDIYISIENLEGSSFNDILLGDNNANVIRGSHYPASASGQDSLYGRGGNDQLFGLDDNDTLNGGTGTDAMNGGAGNDSFFVDTAGDIVVEAAGQGTDNVRTSVSYVLTAGASVETLQTLAVSTTTAINLTGNAFANAVIGNVAANVLNGGGGADILRGMAGNDTFYVDTYSDKIEETPGNGTDAVRASTSYSLGTGVYVETLQTLATSTTTAINLYGNEFVNTVIGNNGANIINGRGGNDTLSGKGGSDIFRFDTALNATTNRDIIIDFLSDDTIQLQNSVFKGLPTPGTLAAVAFHLGTAAGDSSDRIIYNQATGALFYDADGTGGTAAIQFATLSNKAAITAVDFQII